MFKRYIISRRVGRGIKALNIFQPDWKDNINLKLLDVNNLYECPLGQVFGSYISGCLMLGLNDRQTIRYGFNTKSSYDIDLLTAEWHKHLTIV